MPIPKKLITYLEQNKIKYEILEHRTVYTAFDLASTLKLKLSEIAKTLVIKADKEYYLVVLPAHYRLELTKLKKVLNVKKISIANENVMQKVFNVKPGAITPFGSIHKTQVVIDRSLLKSPRVLMGSGSFSESVAMKIKDFTKLEEPIEGVFGKRFTSDVIAKPKLQNKKKGVKKKKAVKKYPTKRKTKKKK
ncbi:YbaK/EbsC family protein [Patescibacteria group bacterium]|nr:YbaK/EbsC family protein [Patescibacteria group bacterium]MBU1075542.1 YbaK/EbsC family protein [Patescibacteria group bacterium]MBU1952181.1 YbaK/EbsC family protein [Patescibacteria group bacterium]MBU2229075.1 YbaK/EbsC family protein [Patescibacteria group bacterium]MBU2235601.1 YbaK/EbsC family protein [Patescibacteria group bacterium]